MKLKILIYPGLLLLLVSLAMAFNLNVVCPGYAFLPGDEVSCNLRLDEDIPRSIFGLQFVIRAGGLTEADGFFQPFDPLAGSSGGLSQPTVLFTLMPFLIEAGSIAEINLEIPPGTLDGDYQVFLEDRIYSEGTPFGSTPGIIRVRALGGPVAGRLGDVTGDGIITLDDAIMVARHALSIVTITNPTALMAADVACLENTINLNDAVAIARVALGILPESSLGCV